MKICSYDRAMELLLEREERCYACHEPEMFPFQEGESVTLEELSRVDVFHSIRGSSRFEVVSADRALWVLHDGRLALRPRPVFVRFTKRTPEGSRLWRFNSERLVDRLDHACNALRARLMAGRLPDQPDMWHAGVLVSASEPALQDPSKPLLGRHRGESLEGALWAAVRASETPLSSTLSTPGNYSWTSDPFSG